MIRDEDERWTYRIYSLALDWPQQDQASLRAMSASAECKHNVGGVASGHSELSLPLWQAECVYNGLQRNWALCSVNGDRRTCVCSDVPWTVKFKARERM